MKSTLLMAALLLPGLVQAHASLEKTEAESGSYYKGVMGIGHGCDGSATTKVTIEIPDGVRGVKPMPKAGWQLDIVKQQLAKPYESHGKTVVEDVRKITWYGNTLAHAHYDEFVFKGQIAVGNSSKLYFPVRQECVIGELNWNQTPESMAADHASHGAMKLEYPAPLVTVIDGQGKHHH
ncbi:MAG: YcnI family protein [Methylophaga sp.]|nr:YcnI family protein [Methylophaga sp.]